MLSLLLVLIILIFKADARGPNNDPVEITFMIQAEELESGPNLICDHNIYNKYPNEYTVLEEEKFTIVTKYNSSINHLICNDYYNNNNLYKYAEKDGSKNVTTFKAEKRMGAYWNCTILVNEDNPPELPVVQYNKQNYTAAYCFMKIHVRQKSCQTILVNNMVLQAVRTDLSEKDVDFIAEYQYADGDVVNVTCANFLEPVPLTMEYMMAGTMSDNSIMAELLSYRAIGFIAKLHSGHNNSYIICTNTEPTDYTKVMVRFVMRTEFNIISVSINGMTLRPKLKNAIYNYYEIDYKYLSHELINVVCEVQRKDMTLVVVDIFDFVGKVSSYKKTELIPKKKAEMSFYLNRPDDKKLLCVSDYNSEGNVEQIIIHFTAGNFHIDEHPLQMELPSNGTVMELFNDDTIDKLKVIFYEFEQGETLQITCGPLRAPWPGPNLYLHFKYSGECKTDGCTVSKTLHLTHEDNNTAIVCYLKEEQGYSVSTHLVLTEIRVILRERVLTTTTSTTTSPVTALTTVITTTNTPADSASSKTPTNSYTLVYCVTAAGVSVIVILAILYWTGKNPCCCIRSSSQQIPMPRPHPDTVFYENELSVFQPINEREAAELENHYEEIQ